MSQDNELPPDTPQTPSKPDKDWEEVFTGKRLPAPQNPAEHEADAMRQVLLWRQAREQRTELTPEDAAAYYRKTRRIQQERFGRRWPNKYLFLLGGGLFLAGGLGLWLVQSYFAIPSTITPAATSASAEHAVPDMPELVTIPAGEFLMGCSAGWDDVLGGCRSNEYPAHSVKVAAFAMSKYEVTVGQFKRFVAETQYVTVAEQEQHGCTVASSDQPGTWVVKADYHWRNPGFVQTDSHPVVCMSWQDTQAYTAWLSKATGENYRLPSEAEWEYAARAGKVTAFYWGSQANRDFANYAGVADKDQWAFTAPVGQLGSNTFGLHDMAGNVWEWVADCWVDSYDPAAQQAGQAQCTGTNTLRVRRGGAWDNHPPSIRSAYRGYGSALERSNLYGFRVVR